MNSTVDLIEGNYIIWVIIAVVVGMIFPGISFASNYSSLLLGIMIGSISLTLNPSNLVNQDLKSVVGILFFQWLIPLLGFILATLFNLPRSLIIGIVIIGVVTPEFVTPVVTHLSKGDTSLSSSVLVISGFSSIITIPIFVYFLIGDDVIIDLSLLVIDLLLILIFPMFFAISIKLSRPKFISRYQEYYSSIATIMLVLLVGMATAANSIFILTEVRLTLILVIIVVTMNLFGYGLGFLSGLFLDQKKKIAAVYSIGMRDFAVAITLTLSSELDPIVALPAVLFGIVEILTSAILVKYFNYSSDKN